MTGATTLCLGIFRGYKSLVSIHKFRERLRIPDPAINLDANYRECNDHLISLARFLYVQTVQMIHRETSPSILGVAQLQMTAALLRNAALDLGPLDTPSDNEKEGNEMEGIAMGIMPNVAAMQMAARLAFEGLSAETQRKDVFDWSVNWFKRQIELDCAGGKGQRGVHEPDTVGHPGVLYGSPLSQP